MLTRYFFIPFQTDSTLLHSGRNPETQVHVTTSVLMMNLCMKSKHFTSSVTLNVQLFAPVIAFYEVLIVVSFFHHKYTSVCSIFFLASTQTLDH